MDTRGIIKTENIDTVTVCAYAYDYYGKTRFAVDVTENGQLTAHKETTEEEVNKCFDSLVKKQKKLKSERAKSRIGYISAFYTGGGIWLCGMYVNETDYYIIDNEYDDYINLFRHDDKEDDDTDFPTQNLIFSKQKKDFTEEEKVIFRKMRKVLLKEMW